MSECPFPLEALISGYTAGLLTASGVFLLGLIIYRFAMEEK